MENTKTKGLDEIYCSSCGEIIKQAAEICPKCGVRQKPAPNVLSALSNNDGKNFWVTLALCFFVGYIGAHRFYTGHIGIGVLQLLTLGCLGIFTLIDFIRILTGSYTDSDGNKLVKT